MDQKKTGEFLKRLRKEKNLTQEQLAERFYVSSRTVSRWETGSNMPDVGMLIELADFYGVDIREIIDGERKGGNMDQETKDTLKKVADYATEKESRKQSKVVYIALGVCILLLVATALFAGETKGLLYGILPEKLCSFILSLIYVAAFGLLVFYMRVRWFLEKPTNEPEKAVAATVVSKEVRSGTNQSGRSMMGYSFVVNFRTEEGEFLELYAYEVEYGGLREGMQGILTYRGPYFVSFEKKTETDCVSQITSSEPIVQPPAAARRTEFDKPQSGKKGIYRIKWIIFWMCVSGLLILLSLPNLRGARGKIVHIVLPFEVAAVENVEMYHFEGTPGYVEKKVIVAEETITALYDMFESLPLKDKTAKESTDAATTSFRFNLTDGTDYELIYSAHGVKKGYLTSTSGNFECFTTADIGACWSNADLEAVRVDASELPK